jgi:hypothetical protein
MGKLDDILRKPVPHHFKICFFDELDHVLRKPIPHHFMIINQMII